MSMFVKFISSAIPLGVPLLYGSTGEIVTENASEIMKYYGINEIKVIR